MYIAIGWTLRKLWRLVQDMHNWASFLAYVGLRVKVTVLLEYADTWTWVLATRLHPQKGVVYKALLIRLPMGLTGIINDVMMYT